jgi:hypothetical protein
VMRKAIEEAQQELTADQWAKVPDSIKGARGPGGGRRGGGGPPG